MFQWLAKFAEHHKFNNLQSALSNPKFRSYINHLLDNMNVQANYGSQANYKYVIIFSFSFFIIFLLIMK